MSKWRRKAKPGNERTSRNFKINKCSKWEWNWRSPKELFAEKPLEWFTNRLEDTADSSEAILPPGCSQRRGGQAGNTHAYAQPQRHIKENEEILPSSASVCLLQKLCLSGYLGQKKKKGEHKPLVIFQEEEKKLLGEREKVTSDRKFRTAIIVFQRRRQEIKCVAETRA